MATKKVPSKKSATKPKAPAKSATKQKRAPAKKYAVSISLNEQVVKYKASTIFEALTQFTAPPFVKTEAVIKVKTGKLASEMVIGVFGTRRTFNNQTALKLLASNLEKRLG